MTPKGFNQKFFVLFIVPILMTSGCATLMDAKMAKGTGEVKIYDAPIEKVWQVAVDSLNTVGLLISSEEKSNGCILAERGMSLNSYGEKVALFINAVDDKKTSVEIVSKKVMKTNIFAPNWVKQLHLAIGNRLENE